MINLGCLLRRSKAFSLGIALASASFIFAAYNVSAQTVTPEDLEFFERLQRETNTGAQTLISPVDRSRESGGSKQPGQKSRQSKQPEPTSRQAPKSAEKEQPLSRIEADYARRLGSDRDPLPSMADSNAGKDARAKRPVVLKQFGYDMFAQPADQSMGVTGRISDDYILGVGDELVITFHGSTQATYITQVDREGRVAVPDLGPIQASGHTFGQFRAKARKKTASALIGTEVHVSVGALRLITIYVMGEVGRPGVYRMTSLSSLVDALSYAGGIEKTGSLRRVLIRRNGSRIPIDLYGILQGKASEDYNLYEGDRIIVPVIGSTAAIVGEVIKPAIYELNKDETEKDILQYAGGPLRPSGYFVGLKRFQANGRQSYGVLEQPFGGRVRQGDILSVQYQEDIVLGSVRLDGHVRAPGERPLNRHPTLKSLVTGVHQLKDGPYLPFAALETTDGISGGYHYRDINLSQILDGKLDYELSDRDRLIVLGTNDIKFLSSPEVRETIVSGRTTDQECPGLNRLAQMVSDSGPERFSGTIRWAAVGRTDITEADVEGFSGQGSQGNSDQDMDLPAPKKATIQNTVSCPQVYRDNEYLLSFVLENVTAVTGAVRKPGIYPVTRNASLADPISAAGGFTNSADRRDIEITSLRYSASAGIGAPQRDTIDLYSTDPAMVGITPRSSIRVPAIPDQQEAGVIVLRGEFLRPGPYTLKKGERLSNVINRAGGLTEQAYPYGAVFTRPSVKEAQTDGLRRSVRDLRTALAGAALKPSARQNLQAALQLADAMEGVELPGRVVIEADPAVLAARPEFDMLVAPGDEIYVPKRPSFVSIAGDVLNPGTVPFLGGRRAKDYIVDAGGFHETAAKGRVFVVLPNGIARPAAVGSWMSKKKSHIPPGSTVVVPIDGSPFDWLQLTRDMTQILGQLSLTAASIAVIADRN